MNWETGIDKYITVYKIANENLLYSTGNSGSVLFGVFTESVPQSSFSTRSAAQSISTS